jgi:TRAP-type C4-dicarboxylate transport system permease small subunit
MKKLMNLFSVLSGIMLAIFFVFVIFDVFFRSALHIPIVWLNEGSTYRCMWMAFISGGVAFFEDLHFKINLFSEKFEKRIDFFLLTCETIFSILFATVLMWQGIKFLRYCTMKYTPALGINMAAIVSVLPLCSFIIIVGIIYRYTLTIMARKMEGKEKQ